MSDRVERFRDLHRPGSPLVMPNPWDIGSARLLASLGFAALATTSSGFALSLGRHDGAVTREESLAHAAALAAAVDVPVSADLEDGFGDSPDGVAATVRAAVASGLAGLSIEDYTRRDDDPIYDSALAAERISAAVEAAHGQLLLTARAENLLHGREDLADTIARLQAFQEAGADVLYAPGLRRRADISTVIASLDRPVNVLLMPDGPTVPELADLGVSRISVGGSFAYAAFSAVGHAARELLGPAPYDFWTLAAAGRRLAQEALS